MQLTRLLVPTFVQTLKNLSTWLDKAAAHQQETQAHANADALMTLRLAPDMFPLAAQVRFACFQAQEPVYRLRGEAVPQSLRDAREEGVKSNAQPGTFADAQARIAGAIAFLSDVAPDALDAATEAPIALDLPNGIVFDMTGEHYARDWSLPQFYFHAVTAYAILRNHGAPLGKPDYVSHMFAYIRPGTLPHG
ncbi:hypothetical protein NOV72_02758 [Caballeronia novacaledonica]|uniref:PF09351 domain protein n=1 Tax=Caballeronia novacaledonica TaxID=1544861 RepID=A0A2U3I5U7_9BURK|nr:DUF1993 domain-containing protein [Caballeronia novacaledonica]SPB15538.1 hypothetical protein NOV72_02758 [Caballeronia novacaledonica]